MTDKINLFKTTYKVHRQTKDIFHGFGFSHREDVTDYFVHDKNEGFSKKTYLSQYISEAVIMFIENLQYEMNGDGSFIRTAYPDLNTGCYEISVPHEWVYKSVFENDSCGFRVKYNDYKSSVAVNVCDRYGKYRLSENVEYIPILVALLYYDYDNSLELKELCNDFATNFNKKNFVILCETFYQNHKYTNYKIDLETVIEYI